VTEAIHILKANYGAYTATKACVSLLNDI
jgi:hypothetical protein